MQHQKGNDMLPNRFGCITPQSAAMLQNSINELLDYSEISEVQKELTELVHNFITSPSAMENFTIEYFSNALCTVTRINTLLSKIQEASNKNLSIPQKLTYELN